MLLWGGSGWVALVGSVSNVHKAVNKGPRSKLGPLTVIGFITTCTAFVGGGAGIAAGGVIMNHSTHVSNPVIGRIILNTLAKVNFSIMSVSLTAAPAARLTIT